MRVTMHLNTAPAGTVFPGGAGGLELGFRHCRRGGHSPLDGIVYLFAQTRVGLQEWG